MTDRVEPQLYLVSPPQPAADFADQVKAALDSGPVASFQLWLADEDEGEIRRLVSKLRPAVQDRDTAFILNGHVKLAAYLECDGVHLDKATPKDIKAARKTLGGDAIIGVSCGTSRHDAMEAAEAGADYVSFGPVYDTATKGLTAAAGALDALTWWAEMMEVPCVAVGGITPENAKPVLRTKCEFICAVSSVWNGPQGPADAVRAFAGVLAEQD